MFETKPYREQEKLRCVLRVHFDEQLQYRRERERLSKEGLSADELNSALAAPPSRKSAAERIATSLAFTFAKRPPGDYTPGRFNTAEFPALYTAGNAEVSCRERQHHWEKGIKEPNPDMEFVVFSLKFTGELRDLRAAIARSAFILPDADYLTCQIVAESAFDDELDGIVAPSKRAPPGSCCALFRSTAIVGFGDVVLEGTFPLPAPK